MQSPSLGSSSEYHIYQTGGSLVSANSSSQLSTGSGGAESCLRQTTDEPDHATIASNLNHTSITAITGKEIDQIRLFFSGNKTQVSVCPVMANMYQKKGGGNAGWVLCYTGVPVLLQDLGCTRSRLHPQLQLLLAERGTGFVLWRHQLQPGTCRVEAPEPAFYTLSGGADKPEHVFGLSFDSSGEAATFMARVNTIMQEAIERDSSQKKSKRVSRAKSLLVKKKDISMPCCFTHVCSVDSSNRLASLQKLVARK